MHVHVNSNLLRWLIINFLPFLLVQISMPERANPPQIDEEEELGKLHVPTLRSLLLAGT